MKRKGLSLCVVASLSGVFGINQEIVANPVTVNNLISPLGEGYVSRAEAMMQNGNHRGAVDQLLELTTASSELPTDVREKAAFLLAKSLFLDNDADALTALSDFCRDYPASVYATEARLLMADSFFSAGEYERAVEIYESVPRGAILPENKNLYSYRLALALLKTGKSSEAQRFLREIKNSPEWETRAKYYLAVIDLENGDLDAAERGFNAVAPFANVYPELTPEWYLTQIEFLRGNYAAAASKGSALLRNDPRNELARRMNRIVGLAYFKQGDMVAAAPYLKSALSGNGMNDKSVALTGVESDEVIYALGECRYAAGEYEAAAELFRQISDRNSAIGQGALLSLGQCEVALGNNDAAAMAFSQASGMDYDTDVTQAALFNYIASRTHGGNVPFATGINLYTDFLTRYPDSPYSATVRENLAAAYFNEKNYAAALESINKIPSPSRTVLEIKQKVLYERGRQLVAAGKPAEAVPLLTEGVSLLKPKKELSAECSLWLGDAYYALKKYQQAASAYREALSTGLGGENAALARYNLAYTLYQQDNYRQAAGEFRKAVDDRQLPATLRADAKVRLADCRYYTGDYTSAADLYADALAGGAGEPDYAAYRHAVMLGLGGNMNAKIIELSEFRNVYPQSRWNPDVLLELGATYITGGKNGDAIKTYEKLVTAYPSSAQARKGALALGTLLIKEGQTDKGEGYLRKLISAFPASEEASLADSDLRNLHASRGTLGEYAAFLASVPGAPGIAPDELESLQFTAARNEFVDNPKNVKGLQKYITDYPSGRNLAPALLMLAKNAAWYNDPADAIRFADRILTERPGASETVEAIMLKAETLEKEFPQRRAEAVAAYRLLEKKGGVELAPQAYAGIMRNTNSDSEKIQYAEKILHSGGVSADLLLEARLCRARGLLGTSRSAEGVKELESLAQDPNSEPGAQAAVDLARHWLATGNVSKAMKLLSDFTSSGTPCLDQLAWGYLLMADAYRAQGNDYMAREYLETLKENYPGDNSEVISGINDRLKNLQKNVKR